MSAYTAYRSLDIVLVQDIDYIKKYYTVDFDGEQAVNDISGRDDSERTHSGKTKFRPSVPLHNSAWNP